jgi:flavin-dependent dehydrogenase
MEHIEDVEVYFGKHVAPGSFAWIVPTNGRSVRIGLIVRNNPSEYLKRFLQHPSISDRLVQNDFKIQCSPIPLGRIPKSYAQRLLIVGEAAGQVKTTTGGGIYFGLLCSEIATNTIYRAFQTNDYSERLFRQYEIAWRKKIDIELKTGLILRRIFSTFSDHRIDYLIDFARRDGVLPFIKKSDFDWHRDLISYLLRHILKRKPFS